VSSIRQTVRDLPYHLLTREQLNLGDPRSIDRALEEYMPWCSTGGSGVLFAKQADDGSVPVDTGATTASAAPEKARTLQRTMAAAGLTEMLAAGAALATTSVLNFNAGRSSCWSAIASVLP